MAAHTTHVQPDAYKWLVLTLATFTFTFVVAIPQMSLPVMFDEISADLSLSLVQVGWIWGAGSVMGILVGLIGGPVGLLAWTVGGAVVGGVAGKYLGRPFSKGDLEEIGDAMAPDSSAFLLLVEDVNSEATVDSMKGYNANVVTLTVGDDLSGQIAQYTAGEATDDQGNVVAGEGAVAADAEGDVAAAADVAAAGPDDSGDNS